MKKNRGHHSIRWIYCEDFSVDKKEAYIKEEKLKHLSTVLRLDDGSPIILTDGKGHVGKGLLDFSNYTSKNLKVQLEDIYQEPLHNDEKIIEVVLGFPKNKTMDAIIEKLSELGVNTLQPVLTSRSIVVPENKEKYLHRWSSIAIQALEQSEQCRLMEIKEILPWTDFLNQRGTNSNAPFIFSSEERTSISLESSFQLLQKATGPLTLLFGPEGGFSETEILDLKNRGFVLLSMGPGILKVETAVVMGTTLAKLALEMKTGHNSQHG